MCSARTEEAMERRRATEIVGTLAMIALALLWLCGLLGLPLPLGQ